MMKFFLIAFFILNATALAQDEKEIDKNTREKIIFQAKKLQYILEKAWINHVDTFDVEEVSNTAFEALLNEFDMQSFYYDRDEFLSLTETHTGSVKGIGIDFVILSDTATIISVIDNSPADSAGLRPGDKILFVDGENIKGLNKNQINKLIKGKEGTRVSLIARRGLTNELKEYVIFRESVKLASLRAGFLIPGTKIGYISYNRFSAISDKEFKETAKKLLEKGMESVIFDVRDNPGGYLKQVTNIIDEFIKEGHVLTYTEPRNPDFKEEIKSTPGGMLEDLPLIVLINKKSASASEIFAGVVQDLDRGLVIGEMSFGKGSVQKIWTMNDSTAFRLTVAEYHTPSGRSIHRREDDDEPAELDEALKLEMGEEKFEKFHKQIKELSMKKQLPVYKSLNGRTIIGGGSIIPDYYVKSDTLTLLTRVLQSKGIILEFVYDYLDSKGSNIREKFANNMNEFINDFTVTDDLIIKLQEFSTSRNIWNEEMFKKDFDYIRAYIKSNIAHSLWGHQGYSAVMIELDKPAVFAIEKMPDAAKMLLK